VKFVLDSSQNNLEYKYTRYYNEVGLAIISFHNEKCFATITLCG